jgi:hypothetical protein
MYVYLFVQLYFTNIDYICSRCFYVVNITKYVFIYMHYSALYRFVFIRHMYMFLNYRNNILYTL